MKKAGSNEIKKLKIKLDIILKEINRLNDKMRESEKKYHDLYENAPDMYHTINKKGIITECNRTEAKMLGYSKDELIGKSVFDSLTSQLYRALDSIILNIAEGSDRGTDKDFE